jgi:AcrR family transcriptional regulator
VNEPNSTSDDTAPRQRLLDAALVEFGEHGYDAVSIRDICKRAGTNVASVNYYFRDKESLYIDTAKFAHFCSNQPLPVWPDDMLPRERLVRFIRGMVTQMHAPTSRAAMKFMMREMAQPGKACQVIVDEFIRPMAFGLRSILAALLPDLPPERLLMTTFSVIGQILFYRLNRPVAELIFGKENVDALTLEMVVEHVTAFTLRALEQVQP